MIRRNREAAGVLAAAVAVFIVVAMARDDLVRLRAYLQVVGLLVVCTALADRAARFSRTMVWFLGSVAVVHLVGGLAPAVGDAPTFYETWLVDRVVKFDQLAHLYGSAVITFACCHLVVGLLRPVRRGWGVALVAVLMAQGIGALNELVEFLFGLGNAEFHAGGLANTGWDLAFNLGGGVVAFALLAADRDEVHDEDEGLVGADDAAGTLSPIGEIGRQR